MAPPSHADYIPHDLVEHLFCLIEEGCEPLSFCSAIQDPKWFLAMTSKFKSILKNDTWDLVPLLPRVRPIIAKSVFKFKPSSLPSAPPTFKARIVACGNEQVHGVNFQETFAKIIKWELIRYIISLAAHLGGPLSNRCSRTLS